MATRGMPPGAGASSLARWFAIACATAFGLAFAGSATADALADGKAAFGRHDGAAALALLRPLADQGDAVAQAYVGTIYLMGEGVPQDVPAAMAMLKKSADQGSADAQFVLGGIYETETFGRQDKAQAVTWFRKAAAQGSGAGVADAQLELGRFYRAGSGVPQDDAIAAQWYSKAVAGFQSCAQRDDAHCETALALIYKSGEGVRRDKLRAAGLYLKVAARYRHFADRGDANAQLELANMYARGQGVPRDVVQAMGWYLRAADQGNPRAQVELGLQYFISNLSGAPPSSSDADDQVQSYIWLTRAMAGTSGVLATQLGLSLDQVKANLTAAQFADADGRARTWTPVKEIPPNDGGIVMMTSAQAAEVARLRHEIHPTPAQIEEAERYPGAHDMALGSATAPVTVFEYASVGCPVCARWDTDVFPAFKAKYVDTGKARFVFRELLVGGPEEMDLGSSGFLLARCVGGDRYFAVLDAVFRLQPDIYGGKVDSHTALVKVGQSFGLSKAQFDNCLSDQTALAAIKARGGVWGRYEHIESTPTLVVNGAPLKPGFQPLAALDAAIGRALGLPSAPELSSDADVPSALSRLIRSPGPHSVVMRAIDDSGPARPGDRPPARGDELAHQLEGGDVWLRPGAIVTSDMFADAQPDTSDYNNQPMITFQLTDEGRRRFGAFTRVNVGRRLAIVFDGLVLSAPIIETPITGGTGEISGRFSAEDAAGIARLINARIQSSSAAH